MSVVLDHVLSRVERAKRNGSGYMARCPAHEDRNPSLAISEGDDGRVLLHCHAGCQTAAILYALGLTKADLFEARNGSGPPEIVATYDYTDEADEIVFQVCRRSDKQFPQRRPDGASGWIWKTRGMRLVLYRLPAVIQAVRSSERVWIVEGEKDVEAIERAGAVATCNPGGAGKWRAEYAEVLRGADVVVVPDLAATGYAHARAIVAALEGIAASIEIRLPASGKDAADHLTAGLGLSDFEAVDVAALDPEPLRGLTFAEARRAEIPPRSELVEDLVDVGTVGLVSGLPFTRKSWFAQGDLAHKVAAGEGLVLGRYPVLVGGPVVVCWQDDSTAKMLERIQLYASRHSYPDNLPLRFLLNEGIRLPDDLPELRALLEREGAVLLVLDSLYNVVAPKLALKEEGVAEVLKGLKADLCDPLGCTVAVVDHAPWPTESNRGQRRAYGSVFKTAAVRWAIHLEADASDESKLYVEASGNNVAGFRRSLAAWDEDALEIRLLDVQRIADEERDELVLKYLREAGWASTKAVTEGVTGRAQNVRESLRRLDEAGTITSASSRELGRPGTGTYWNLAQGAAVSLVPLPGTTPDDPAPGYVTNTEGRPVVPPPKGGRPSAGRPSSDVSGTVDEAEIERLAAVAMEAQQ